MEGLSLRPQPLLAHWAPGAVLTVIGLFYVAGPDAVRLFWRYSSGFGTPLFILVFALVSFAIGQVLDALRDGIFEDLWDWIGRNLPQNGLLTKTLRWLGAEPVNWDFFVASEPDVVDKFEVWFYSHYMLSFNLGVGLLVLMLFPWWVALEGVQPNVLGAVKDVFYVSSGILIYDALRLRHHVARITNKR